LSIPTPSPVLSALSVPSLTKDAMYFIKRYTFFPIPYRSAMRLFRIGLFQLSYFFPMEGSPLSLSPFVSCDWHSPGFIPAPVRWHLVKAVPEVATRSTSRKSQVVWSRHAAAAAYLWNTVLCYLIEHRGILSEVRLAATTEKSSPPSASRHHYHDVPNTDRLHACQGNPAPSTFRSRRGT